MFHIVLCLWSCLHNVLMQSGLIKIDLESAASILEYMEIFN